MTTNRQMQLAAEIKNLREENDHLRVWILVVTGARTDDRWPPLEVPADGSTITIPRDALAASYKIAADHHQILGAQRMQAAISAMFDPHFQWRHRRAVLELDATTVIAEST